MTTRPLYETANDRTNETFAVEKLCDHFGCEIYQKLPISYGFDFALIKADQVRAVVEVKRRNKRYDTLMISPAKILRGVEYDRAGIVPYIAIDWPDGLFYYRLQAYDPNRYPVKIGGRTDRGDPQDIEPVVMIPTTVFRKVPQ